jgi:hypothetical protein
MFRRAVALSVGVAIALVLPLSAAHAKRHSADYAEGTESDSNDETGGLSEGCGFGESRTIGNRDPSRSLPERCENRASEMCIFGFGYRGFKPHMIRIDPAIHSACLGITTPKALACINGLTKVRAMESGGRYMITGGKRKNRIIHLPALNVSEITRCATQ